MKDADRELAKPLPLAGRDAVDFHRGTRRDPDDPRSKGPEGGNLWRM